MSCCKCDKKAYVNYKDKNYCTWYCAKKGQFMIELTCKKCDDVTMTCDEGVVSVTCGLCSMADVRNEMEVA